MSPSFCLIWAYFVFYIVAALFQILIAEIAYYIKPELSDNYAAMIIMALAPMYFIGAPVGWLIIKKIPAEKPAPVKWNAGQILGGFFAAYGLIYVSNLIGTTIGTAIESLVPGAQAATNDVQDLIFSGNISILPTEQLSVDRAVIII